MTSQSVCHTSYMNEITDVEAAWLAGWTSADGCILAGPPPRIKFTICDRDVLEEIARIVGFGTVGGPWEPTGFGKQQRYGWQISGRKAFALGERMRPWLSARYRERLDAAHLAWQPLEHLGRSLTPDDVAVIKTELRASPGYGTARRLAKAYGVTDAMISSIRHERSWRHVA